MADYEWFESENCQCHRQYGDTHRNWCDKSPYHEQYLNGWSFVKDGLYACRGCGSVVRDRDLHLNACRPLQTWVDNNRKEEVKEYSVKQLEEIVGQAILDGEQLSEEVLNRIADELHRLDDLES